METRELSPLLENSACSCSDLFIEMNRKSVKVLLKEVTLSAPCEAHKHSSVHFVAEQSDFLFRDESLQRFDAELGYEST